MNTPRPAVLMARSFNRDPGVQAERTALAWNRTGLALTANALLAIRAGMVNEAPLLLFLGGTLLLAATMLVPLGGWRKRQLLGPGTPRAPRPYLLLAVCTVAMLACATAIFSMVPLLERLTA